MSAASRNISNPEVADEVRFWRSKETAMGGVNCVTVTTIKIPVFQQMVSRQNRCSRKWDAESVFRRKIRGCRS